MGREIILRTQEVPEQRPKASPMGAVEVKVLSLYAPLAIRGLKRLLPMKQHASIGSYSSREVLPRYGFKGSRYGTSRWYRISANTRLGGGALQVGVFSEFCREGSASFTGNGKYRDWQNKQKNSGFNKKTHSLSPSGGHMVPL